MTATAVTMVFPTNLTTEQAVALARTEQFWLDVTKCYQAMADGAAAAARAIADKDDQGFALAVNHTALGTEALPRLMAVIGMSSQDPEFLNWITSHLPLQSGGVA